MDVYIEKGALYDKTAAWAEKIITGTKPRNEDDAMSFFLRAIFGDPNATREEGEEALKNVNMFTLKEIEEIAHYLLLYCEVRKIPY